MSYNQLLSLFHCNAQIVSNMASGSLSSRKMWFLNGTRQPVVSGQLWNPSWGWKPCCPPACALTQRITLHGEPHTIWLWGSAFPQWVLSDSGDRCTLDGCCHVEHLCHLPNGSQTRPLLPRSRPPSESGEGTLIFLLPVKYQEPRHGQASCRCYLVPWVPLR